MKHTKRIEAASPAPPAETPMRLALRRLRAEVAGCLGLAEAEIRQAIGNTNFATLKLRVKEAGEALEVAEAASSLPRQYARPTAAEVVRLDASLQQWEPQDGKS